MSWVDPRIAEIAKRAEAAANPGELRRTWYDGFQAALEMARDAMENSGDYDWFYQGRVEELVGLAAKASEDRKP